MTDITGRLTAAVADRYVVERELGHGGMATVYLAHDVRHNRKVALKVLRPELAAMIGAERFLGRRNRAALVAERAGAVLPGGGMAGGGGGAGRSLIRGHRAAPPVSGRKIHFEFLPSAIRGAPG